MAGVLGASQQKEAIVESGHRRVNCTPRLGKTKTKEDGDFLVYGCDVAQGTSGKDFLTNFSQ